MMNYFLYSIGNDVRSCEKEEYIPRDATGILKVQNGASCIIKNVDVEN